MPGSGRRSAGEVVLQVHSARGAGGSCIVGSGQTGRPRAPDSKGRQCPVPNLWDRFVPCVLTYVSGEGVGSWVRSPPFSPSTARVG